MNIKYTPVPQNAAEWGNKQAILSRYEGLNIHTFLNFQVKCNDDNEFLIVV